MPLILYTAGSETPKLTRVEVSQSSLYTVMSKNDRLAKLHAVSLQDLELRDWVLFERHVHPTVYDLILQGAAKIDIKPKAIQHVMTAEEAAPLLDEEERVAFLTRSGGWRIAKHGITMRPPLDKALLLSTAPTTIRVFSANSQERSSGSCQLRNLAR